MLTVPLVVAVRVVEAVAVVRLSYKPPHYRDMVTSHLREVSALIMVEVAVVDVYTSAYRTGLFLTLYNNPHLKIKYLKKYMFVSCLSVLFTTFFNYRKGNLGYSEMFE